MNAPQQPAERVGTTAPQPYGPNASSHPHAPIAELVGDEVRHRMIAEAAYFRAKHRGFSPGHELDDWLAAENEVDTALLIGLPL